MPFATKPPIKSSGSSSKSDKAIKLKEVEARGFSARLQAL